MLIDEAISYLDSLIAGLETELPKISEELALTASSMIINRIQQDGLPGKSYSDQKLPSWYFEDRALNSGGRSLLEKHNKKQLRKSLKDEGYEVKKNKRIDDLEDGISYREWRLANGLQVSHIDLTFTGRMFQNTGVIGTVVIDHNYITIIGGFDKEIKDKLRWNAIRFGEFFAVTDNERSQLREIFNNRMQSFKARIR